MLAMHDAVQHLVLLVFSLGLAVTGRLMAAYPLRTYRLLTFGNDYAPKILVGFCRLVGWFFAVVFTFGSLMYLVLIFRDLMR